MNSLEKYVKFNDNIVVDFNGRIKNKRQIEQYVKNVIRYFIPKLRRVIYVNISVTNALEDNCLGFCLGDKRNIEIELSRTCFNKPISFEQQMITLAHELVHAKQFLTGQLSPKLRNWKGEANVQPYSRSPYEREAYRKETWLYENFWR